MLHSRQPDFMLYITTFVAGRTELVHLHLSHLGDLVDLVDLFDLVGLCACACSSSTAVEVVVGVM